MKIPTKTGSGESRPTLEAASYPAVLVAIVDLGTHTEQGFGDRTAEDKRKVLLVWELPSEIVAGTKDRRPLICKDFRLSLHEKASLRAWILGMLPSADRLLAEEEFEMEALLGSQCLITLDLKENGKGRAYNKATKVSPLVRGMLVPAPTRTPFAFWVAEHDPAALPDWLPYLYGQPVKEKVLACHELSGRGVPACTATGHQAPSRTNPPPPPRSATPEKREFGPEEMVWLWDGRRSFA